MSRRRRNGLMIAVIICVAIAGAVWWSTGPRYQGRSLVSWVRQYSEADDGSASKLEAQRAIRAMPRHRVVSRLVGFAKASVDNLGSNHGGVRDWVVEIAERLNVPDRYLTWMGRPDVIAVAGFEAMGTNAAVAIPKLVAMGKEPKYGVIAIECLAEIGFPARQSICAGLTNANVLVRSSAVSSLANVFPDVESMLETVKPLLHDRDSDVRRHAIELVGWQTNAPNLAMPLLCEVVREGESHDVIAATQQIQRFGTNALQAIGTISNVVERLPPSVATRVALGVMAKICPAQALPLVLRKCKSPDAQDRQMAVELLISYPTNSAGMFSTLEQAARDPSPPVASMAQSFFKEHYRRVYPNGPPFEEEPTYDRRLLGYWLKQRNNDGEILAEGKTAIRAMGSNAVPALLSRFFYMYPHEVPAYDVNIEAVGGFYILGEAGVAALPKLQPVIDDTNETMALYALMAVSQMGEQGNECIVRALTNRHEMVRVQAVNLVMEQHAKFSIQQRAACIGVLTNMLVEKEEGIRMSVTNVLIEMAQNGRVLPTSRRLVGRFHQTILSW